MEDQVNYVLCSYCSICFLVNQANRAKGMTEFVMALSFTSKAESSHDCVPKPILTKLNNLKIIRCAIQNEMILVCNVDSQ